MNSVKLWIGKASNRPDGMCLITTGGAGKKKHF
jgi:hypothetical protein